ncbi:MAG: cation transporter [Candidatus Omnitrophica bacterium CG07_land_8_20_14_0_80_50_8]|nr:MAG: hypothetical protein AUJ71_00340 [Candidatus Omnitrophica bacterium CG1_02_49_16]PIU40526.1 MAG: cation transporter [Candidatus Omnitrophica bacterium CG07_land_8_20_14_0_80_50_8]
MNAAANLTRPTRVHQIAVVLWVTLGLNWLVAALKIMFGLVTGCMVIIADGAHSFSDGTSNIIGLIAIHVSASPPDNGHPYGHQKYETLASAVIAFLLFVVSFSIFKEAIHSFIHPTQPEVNALSFGLMTFTLVVNLFVVWYERRAGRRLKSDLLISDAWHTLTDVLVTLTVFVALAGIYWNVPRMDSIFSLLIAAVIVTTALGILKTSSDVLCDKAVLDLGQIEKIVRSVDGVQGCHQIRTRGRTDDIYVDLHVLVDNEMTVARSHQLANTIEHDIKNAKPGIHDVVVHVEPVSHQH